MTGREFATVVVLFVSLAPGLVLLWDWWTLSRIPAPEEGQCWRSRNSGKCILIDSVEVTDGGMLQWSYRFEVSPGQFSGIGMTGHGLTAWRRMVREERRELLFGPQRGHVPPRPMPPPAPG